MSLKCTFEDSDELGNLQFLELLLNVNNDGLCWSFCQRKAKAVLPNKSFYSYIIKRGLISSMFRSSVLKSCEHKVFSVCDLQMSRLKKAGYLESLITDQIFILILSFSTQDLGDSDMSSGDMINNKKIVVIPYYHRTST